MLVSCQCVSCLLCQVLYYRILLSSKVKLKLYIHNYNYIQDCIIMNMCITNKNRMRIKKQNNVTYMYMHMCNYTNYSKINTISHLYV